MTSWYGDGSDDERVEETERQDLLRRLSKSRRFFLWDKDNIAESRVVFQSDRIITIHEHPLKLRGKRINVTCNRKISALAEQGGKDLEKFKGGCPACALGDPVYVGLVQILNITPFKITSGADAGKEIKNYSQLMPFRKNGVEWFHQELALRGTMVGATYKFTRDPKKAGQPSTGDGSFIKMVDLDQEFFLKVDRKGNLIKPDPVDAEESVYPLTYDQQQELVAAIMSERSLSNGNPHKGGKVLGRASGGPVANPFEDDDHGAGAFGGKNLFVQGSDAAPLDNDDDDIPF